MNRKGLGEVMRAFLAYCREDKTRWDIADQGGAFLLLAGGLLALTWAAVVFAGAN